MDLVLLKEYCTKDVHHTSELMGFYEQYIELSSIHSILHKEWKKSGTSDFDDYISDRYGIKFKYSTSTKSVRELFILDEAKYTFFLLVHPNLRKTPDV